jgi:hypothetical protein
MGQSYMDQGSLLESMEEVFPEVGMVEDKDLV